MFYVTGVGKPILFVTLLFVGLALAPQKVLALVCVSTNFPNNTCQICCENEDGTVKVCKLEKKACRKLGADDEGGVFATPRSQAGSSGKDQTPRKRHPLDSGPRR